MPLALPSTSSAQSAPSRFSRRLFLDMALPSVAGIALLLVVTWIGITVLRRSQMKAMATYRVEALRRHLATQGEGLDGLGQMLSKSWTSLKADGQASEHAVHAALPLLRQQDLVSNLILCAPDGNFLTLIRTTVGWDLVEGGPAFGPGRGRLTKQVDAPGSQVSWVRLPENYPLDRPWFQEGMVLDRPGWMSHPYQFVDTPMGGLSYLVPVINAEGTRLGLVCLDSTQNRVSRAMSTVLDNPFGRAMITNPAGQVVVPPQWPTMPDAEDAYRVPAVRDIPWAAGLLDKAPKDQAPAEATAVIGGLTFLTYRAPVALGSTFQGELWVAFPMTLPGPFLPGGGLALVGVVGILLLAWFTYLRWMSRRYDQPMQRLLHSAEAASRGVDVPDLDSDIWELRQVGHSLQLTGRALKARRGLEDQLLQTQRFEVMSALSGGVIHDSNNVLSIVMLRIERALERGWGPKSAEDLKEGLDAAKRCIAMNRQMLSLGRKEDDTIQWVDLSECLKDISLLVRPALGREIVLAMDLAPEPLPVAIRTVELTQAVLNLALNARDAMPQGGRLLIRTRRVSGEAHLEVEDGGEGIPEAIHSRIFEPYFTTKPKGKGTGLGLAVVKRVVERHSGRIELHRREGRGQCFLLVFPLAPE
ncbi:MAG: histidine kinase [Holophagaceae bacterium]|nr:histidine kinase [Holophagaceae bacterium]